MSINSLTPLVFASHQQREVKQDPKEEPPSHRNPQAAPLTQIRYPLLLQYIRSGGHARGARDIHPQSSTHATQQLQLHCLRD